MELEVLAGCYLKRPPQVVDRRLIGRQLVEISRNHVPTQIELAMLASPNRKSTARIELSKNGGIPFRSFGEACFIITRARVRPGGLPGLFPVVATSTGLGGTCSSTLRAHIRSLRDRAA